ncbi:hypothetical protein LJR153_007248 [Paenibacillus sp. LjRoot153]|uniref:hypothetical protein n=1 Tax=Paenibacillus sp. LjRoot153 TaxID=3342270 RepID=UPI003ED0ECA6
MSHISVGFSLNMFRAVFEKVRDTLQIPILPKPYSYQGGSGMSTVTITLKGKARLENGTVDFIAPDRLRISELDIVFDELKLTIKLDIDEIAFGDECIIQNPINEKCIVNVPKKSIFEANPDVVIKFNLVPLVPRVELSFDLILDEKKTDGVPSHWAITGQPDLPDIEIDFADSLGDLIQEKLTQAIKDIIPGNSSFERVLVQKIRSFGEFVRNLLDVGDDIQEWAQRTLLNEIGLGNIIIGAVLDYYQDKLNATLFKIPNPYPVINVGKLKQCNGLEISLPPVYVEIDTIQAKVTDDYLFVNIEFSDIITKTLKGVGT